MYKKRMDLNAVAVFLKVAQMGSFSQAARQLGMPNSTVSAKVSALERHVGMTLIQRTTRRLHLTSAGQEYFHRCMAGLAEIQAAEADLLAQQSEPSGLLRVTAPVEMGGAFLPAIIAEYITRFSKVQVELVLTDRRVELLADGIDVALRVGKMKDSTLMAKKMGDVFFAPFASPRYIKNQGSPKQPRDLRQHQCLQFTPIGAEVWTLTSGQGTQSVPVPSRIMVNDLIVVRSMAIAGVGIALLPNFFCSRELQSGELVRVLPNWHTQHVPVHFVYPAQRFVSPKLKEFITMAEPAVKKGLASKIT